MRLLVDTNVLLWAADTPERLSRAARGAIESHALCVSHVSEWEIAIKMSIGKLTPKVDMRAWIEESGFERLPITEDHVWAVARLPHHHRDPFDRLLVAQALHEDMTLITSDPRLVEYGVPVIRA